jgi:hypothetical protein
MPIHAWTCEERFFATRVSSPTLNRNAHLAEIRSIVVHPDTKGHGAGCLLVRALLDQAKSSDIKCVCLFTRIPTFFEHFHFRVAERQTLRDKVLKDCVHCARRNACDEMTPLPAAQRQLRVTVTPAGEEAAFLRLDVEDSGPGLRGRAFEELVTPFYSTKPEGMGMGPAICRSIIEHHGALMPAPALGGASLLLHAAGGDDALPATQSEDLP